MCRYCLRARPIFDWWRKRHEPAAPAPPPLPGRQAKTMMSFIILLLSYNEFCGGHWFLGLVYGATGICVSQTFRFFIAAWSAAKIAAWTVRR